MSKTQLSIDQHRTIGADLMQVSDMLGDLATLMQGRDHEVYANTVAAGRAILALRIALNDKHRAEHAPTPNDLPLYFGKRVAKTTPVVASSQQGAKP